MQLWVQGLELNLVRHGNHGGLWVMLIDRYSLYILECTWETLYSCHSSIKTLKSTVSYLTWYTNNFLLIHLPHPRNEPQTDPSNLVPKHHRVGIRAPSLIDRSQNLNSSIIIAIPKRQKSIVQTRKDCRNHVGMEAIQKIAGEI